MRRFFRKGEKEVYFSEKVCYTIRRKRRAGLTRAKKNKYLLQAHSLPKQRFGAVEEGLGCLLYCGLLAVYERSFDFIWLKN